MADRSGLVGSIGSVGDAFDNDLAETTIGLYKTEAIRNDSPFRHGQLRRLADVEALTAEWVHCYNTSRLMPPPRADPTQRVRAGVLR